MTKRNLLILVAVVGVLAGFLIMRALQAPTLAPGPLPAVQDDVPVGGETTASGGPGDAPASLTSGSPGSSISVVGGMSAQEMAELGIQRPGSAPAGQLVPQPDRPGLAPGETPSADRFPPAVAAAASRYTCLCGCQHELHICPCNDQPVGAVTMLSYLQRMMEIDDSPEVLDAAMVERYGQRVLLSP